jgi:hypothetical protein
MTDKLSAPIALANTESVEPIFVTPRTLAELPKQNQSSVDNELPQRNLEYTETALPSLATARRDNVEPMLQ